MAKFRTLSSSAIIELQQMRDRIKRLEQSLAASNNTPQQAPPHYLVKAKAGGIPAMTSVDPGEADATLVIRSGASRFLVDQSRDIKVWNYSTTSIAENTIVMAHRDAWGDYYVLSTGGSSCCDCVEGEIESVGPASVSTTTNTSYEYAVVVARVSSLRLDDAEILIVENEAIAFAGTNVPFGLTFKFGITSSANFASVDGLSDSTFTDSIDASGNWVTTGTNTLSMVRKYRWNGTGDAGITAYGAYNVNPTDGPIRTWNFIEC